MTVYLDSSVVIRPLFDQPGKLRSWGKWETAYSSELLGVECRRAIDRLRLLSLYDDRQVGAAMEQLGWIERTIKRIRLTKPIIAAASRTMPTLVKTLDAFHLVSAVAIRERRGIELVFATHDSQQAAAARALGFSCMED
jgi:predicted nucleic acid-binding protein